jgi:hypothetical protein
MDIDTILKLLQDNVSSASREKIVDDLNQQSSDRIEELQEQINKLDASKSPISDVFATLQSTLKGNPSSFISDKNSPTLHNISQQIDRLVSEQEEAEKREKERREREKEEEKNEEIEPAEETSLENDIDNEPQNTDTDVNVSDQKENDSVDSEDFDYTAYRERLDDYVRTQQEQELEDFADNEDCEGSECDIGIDQSDVAIDGADGYAFPDSLLPQITVCIGNDIEQAASGYSLDGVYTSQLSYVNGKRWYKLTSPKVLGDEPVGETTIKFTSGAWRIETPADDTIYYTNGIHDNVPSPVDAPGWLVSSSASGTWPSTSNLNVYSCTNNIISETNYEFNFTYATWETIDQFLNNGPSYAGEPHDAIPWTITPAPESIGVDVAVEFAYGSSSPPVIDSGDVQIDPLNAGTSISSFVYTYRADESGNGFTEFRNIRDPLSANIDGNENLLIRFVSGSDYTGQHVVSGGSVSAVSVTFKDTDTPVTTTTSTTTTSTTTSTTSTTSTTTTSTTTSTTSTTTSTTSTTTTSTTTSTTSTTTSTTTTGGGSP